MLLTCNLPSKLIFDFISSIWSWVGRFITDCPAGILKNLVLQDQNKLWLLFYTLFMRIQGARLLRMRKNNFRRELTFTISGNSSSKLFIRNNTTFKSIIFQYYGWSRKKLCILFILCRNKSHRVWNQVALYRQRTIFFIKFWGVVGHFLVKSQHSCQLLDLINLCRSHFTLLSLIVKPCCQFNSEQFIISFEAT